MTRKLIYVVIATLAITMLSACSKRSKALEAIKTDIEVSSKQCPMMIAPGLVLTGIDVVGDKDIEYYISTDEKYYNVTLMPELKDMLMHGLINMDDEETARLIGYCKEAGVGLMIYFNGSNGTRSQVHIDADEF